MRLRRADACVHSSFGVMCRQACFQYTFQTLTRVTDSKNMPTCTRLTQKIYKYSLSHLKWNKETKKETVWKSILNLSFVSLFSTILGKKDLKNKINDSISIPILILERHFSRKLGKRDLENKINDSISISNLILVGLFSTKLVKRDLENKMIDWDLRINKWQSKCNRLYCGVGFNTATYAYLFSEWCKEREMERERDTQALLRKFATFCI